MEAAAAGSGSAAAAARGRVLLLCGHPPRPLVRNAAAPPPRSSSAPPRRRQDWNPREQKAADAFTRAILELDCVHAYMALTEEDVREEYRRAGKLHRYDPANDELGKRIARVIKMYPPPPGLFGDPVSYLQLLEDEED